MLEIKISDEDIMKQQSIPTIISKKAELIIEEELAFSKKQYTRQQADNTILILYSKFENITKKKCEDAINKLKVQHTIGKMEHQVLNDMIHSITNQILEEPIKMLRDAEEQDNDLFIKTVSELFNLNSIDYDRCK